jgi:hypothetical protein
MIIRKKTREVSKQYVQRKLLFRLRRMAIFMLVMFGIIVYHISTGHIQFLLSVAAAFAGYLVGILFSRYANIHWHVETGMVVSKMDKLGIVVLIVYLAFSISRRWLLGHWIHGPALGAASLSMAFGAIAGRILSQRKQIRVILRDKGLIDPK